jgi:hypothetical protein
MSRIGRGIFILEKYPFLIEVFTLLNEQDNRKINITNGESKWKENAKVAKLFLWIKGILKENFQKMLFVQLVVQRDFLLIWITRIKATKKKLGISGQTGKQKFGIVPRYMKRVLISFMWMLNKES